MQAVFVAERVIKGIRRKNRNKPRTWEGRFTALFERIFPDLVDRAYYYGMSREPKPPVR